MPVIDRERIACIGPIVETERQGDEGTEMHVAAPKLGQSLAAHAHGFDPSRLAERLDRWNLLGQHQPWER